MLARGLDGALHVRDGNPVAKEAGPKDAGDRNVVLLAEPQGAIQVPADPVAPESRDEVLIEDALLPQADRTLEEHPQGEDGTQDDGVHHQPAAADESPDFPRPVGCLDPEGRRANRRRVLGLRGQNPQDAHRDSADQDPAGKPDGLNFPFMLTPP